MPFDIYVCKKFCPYLKGRFPSFGISWSSDGTCFAPKNGEGCGQCVVTREEAPFSLPKGKIRKWMAENVDVEHDLRNCPCYAEHLLSEYAHKK